MTVIHSPRMIGQMLWTPGENNFFDDGGLCLELRGAIPDPGPPDGRSRRMVAGTLSALLTGIGDAVDATPPSRMEEGQIASADQKHLRSRLPGWGLMCFIADGSRVAREYTRYRPYHRVAGPKQGVHVPFTCPSDAAPIEVDLPCSNETVTGLGIRQGEVLAVTGSNAEGKSTLLQAIIAGEDDHAPGDGQERLVTVRGACQAQTGAEEMRGQDISLFFSSLPPGIGGAPSCVSGRGSGSMVMAARIQDLIGRKCPLLLIDEDSAATNLLVPCATQITGVTPLADIIARHRHLLGGTAVVAASGTMDYLAARADRILALDGHRVTCIDRVAFCDRLRDHYRRMADSLGEGDGHSDP
ncbi:MAG: P-loop domain-containing protein [Methanomicrobiales archaeon]